MAGHLAALHWQDAHAALNAAASYNTAPSPYASGLLDRKELRKKGSPCTGPFCRSACALRCVRGKCLKHCTDDGGCPIHLAGSSDQEHLDKDEHVFTQADDELL